MSKTLLLLNGHTVTLTEDGDDGTVHGSLALAGEAQGQAKAYPSAGGEQGCVDGRARVMQVTVGGQNIGQGQGDRTVVHKVQGHSILHPAKRTVAAEGSFVPLPMVPLQGSACLDQQQQQQAGGSLEGEVFTLAQLLPQGTEDEASISTEQQHQDSASVQGLGGMEVRAPQASAGAEDQVVQGQAKGESTLVAIIQGDDGTSQTVELSPEAACRLGLSQLLQDTTTTAPTTTTTATTAMQPLPDPLVLTTAAGEAAHPAQAPEAVSMFSDSHQGLGEGQEPLGGEGEETDVSLGPFLLIPEYNEDGSIATVLQIRGSGAEAMPGTARISEALGHSSALPETTQASEPARRATATESPPRPSPNVQKIRLPLAPQAPQAPVSIPRKQNLLKAAAPEWRAVAMAQPGPKVSGSSYLRDVAKRTKFRNLTSILEARQEAPTTQPVTTAAAAAAITACHRAVPGITSARPAQGTNTTNTTVSTYHHPSSTSPPPPQEAAKPVTIRVSTGPINATSTTTTATTTTATTITTTSTTTSLSVGTPTPSPSIKCAESSEVVGGSTSLAEKDKTSLTSIVYSASGHDTTPFAVHLPGGDDTKPLGSSENPIQLVQQGNTFQALQPVQERQLEQITTLLQQRRITAAPTTHRDEIYDPKTNMKIVYKVVYPEDSLPGEHKEDEEDEDEDEEEEEEEEEEVDVGGCMKEDMSCLKEGEEEEAWEAQNTLVKRRGRKPRWWKKARPIEDDTLEDYLMEESWESKQPLSRTRSGRISRPPRHIVKDFKHLRPGFDNATKDKGEGEDAEHLPAEPDKVSEPVIPDLPRRKKRIVPALTRLRYTCGTCGKLYMGRIDAHYRQFPDHCRKPLSPEHHQQKTSYSAIKSLSEVKPSEDDTSEINKSVLSPTPGTQASETSGEPSLPMETLTTQPQHTQEDPLQRLEFEDTQQPPARARRGRGRRKSRGRRGVGHQGGRPRATTAIANLDPKPIKVLEKILSSYTSQDIQNAVGQRLFQNLSPWQMLCLQVDRQGSWPQWQDRLRLLEDLLKECREEFHSQTEPLPCPSSNLQEERDLCGSPRQANRAGAGQDKGAEAGNSEPLAKAAVESFRDTEISEADSSGGVTKEAGGSFEVSDYLANILGVMSCEYQLKSSPSSTPSPLLGPSPVPPLDPYLPQDVRPPQQPTQSSGKRPLDQEGNEDAESPPKKCEAYPEISARQRVAQDVAVTPAGECGSMETAGTEEPIGNKYSITMDCISLGPAADKASENNYSVGLNCAGIDQGTDKLKGIGMDCVGMEAATDKADKNKYGTGMECVSLEAATDNASSNKYSLGMECVSLAPGTDKSKDKFGVGLGTATDKVDSNKFSLSSALEAATCSLPLGVYTLPGQLGPDVTSSHTATDATPGMLRTSATATQLTTTTLPHLSDCVAGTGSTAHTTLTTTHPTIPTTSLPLEIPNFSTHITSPPTLTSCLPLSTIDSAFSTATMPQVSSMQQMPLGDMDITAEDLPRLLSEGTGLVVGGSNDGCDAPKLLDTSGDTTDLSEMLFKLQEATAGITSQSQEASLGSQMYQVGVSGTSPQLMSSQGLHTHTHTHTGVALSAQAFSQHPQHTSGLTHTEARQSVVEPSMPLLTFSGALNSEFDSTSSLSQVISQAQDANKMQLNTDFHGGSSLSQVISQAQEANNTGFHSNTSLSQVISQAQESNKMQLGSDFHSDGALSHVLSRSDGSKSMQLTTDFSGQVMSHTAENKTMQLNSDFHAGSGLSQVINPGNENKMQLDPTFHDVNRSEDNKIQAILSQVSDQLDRTPSEQSTDGKVGEGEQIHLGFGTTFEELLKS